jgi:predicted ester cyclase
MLVRYRPGCRMSDSNKQLARRWFEEVWNKQDEEAIDAMFSAVGKCHGFPEPDSVLEGPDDFKIIHRSFIGAFPDLHIEVEDVIAEGDKVAIRWTATMTHLGDHLGIPPSLKQARLAGSSFMTIKNSHIIDGWNFMELQGLLKSLKDSAD